MTANGSPSDSTRAQNDANAPAGTRIRFRAVLLGLASVGGSSAP